MNVSRKISYLLRHNPEDLHMDKRGWVNVEDLLTLDITFHGQPSAGNVDNTNEATIVYRA